MTREKKTIPGFKEIYLPTAGVLVLILLAAALLLFSLSHSTQAVSALVAQVCFEGEYRIGDGPWQTITEGQHIPSTKGDVTLRGNFHMYAPNGEYVGHYTGDLPIAFYLDHISVTVCEGDLEPWTFEIGNPMYGDSACGVCWNAYSLAAEGSEPIELWIHNPHRFGNENAIDEMLSGMALWSGIDFERSMMDRGQVQRNTGLAFIMISFVLLGSALFSTLLRVPKNRIIWRLGATVLSAGAYLAFSAPGVSFWIGIVAVNTSVLGFSMMFYMLFLSEIITSILKHTKPIGAAVTTVMGAVDGLCLLLPMVTGLRFYDTWLPWAVLQSGANLVLLLCLFREFRTLARQRRLGYLGLVLPLVAFEADVIATALGIWKGGLISEYVFVALFAETLFTVLWLIPEGIHAQEKAKELERQRSRLEAELKESRVALMLSQIQPHFIYNTLGTIERMCLKDPQKAFELVRNFSLYLRGNFSELNSVIPIRFSEELKHVEHYVNIEKVRFPDMTIEYDVETTDFVLPALTVQPLVENAIKHGLMRLESGGRVVIRSYETADHFCVEVTDDGVGFDTEAPVDNKKHVGLRNIRGRLSAMVNGSLTVESKVGAGTKAVIMIPKE